MAPSPPHRLGGPRVAALLQAALARGLGLTPGDVVRRGGASARKAAKQRAGLADLLAGRPVPTVWVLRWAEVLGCARDDVLHADAADRADEAAAARAEDESRRRRLRTFQDEVPLLLRHRDLVLSDERLAGATHPRAALCVGWIGEGLLPLGALLRLWDGPWQAGCPACDGRVLIHAVGGSALSGSHSWTGVCTACAREVHHRDSAEPSPIPRRPRFAALWQAASPLWVRPAPVEVEVRGRRAQFGLVADDPPATAPPPWTFEEAVERLRRAAP